MWRWVGLLLVVAACTPPMQAQWHLHGVTVHTDNLVELGPLQESVVPLNESTAPERALVLPLVVEGEAAHRRALGTGLTGTLVDVWRSMGIFAALEMDETARPQDMAEALSLARAKGASVLVWGRLAPVLVGGGLGRTEIGVRLEAVWVATGQTFWAASQAGILEAGNPRDYVLVQTRSRLPRYPEVAVMAALAESLGRAYLAHKDDLP